MDAVVGVDGVNDLDELFPAHVLGQDELLHRHTQGVGPLAGGALVAEVVGPLAAADDGHGGVHAPGLEGLAVRDDAGVQFLVDFLA